MNLKSSNQSTFFVAFLVCATVVQDFEESFVIREDKGSYFFRNFVFFKNYVTCLANNIFYIGFSLIGKVAH